MLLISKLRLPRFGAAYLAGKQQEVGNHQQQGSYRTGQHRKQYQANVAEGPLLYEEKNQVMQKNQKCRIGDKWEPTHYPNIG